MTGSAFPTAVDTIRADVTNATDEQDLHPLLHNQVAAGLVAVQTELIAHRTFVVTSARFGARPDLVTLTDIYTTAGSTALVSSGGHFTPSMAGKTVSVVDAADVYDSGHVIIGAGNHYATLQYINSGLMTMSRAADRSVSAGTAHIGTDNAVPINAAIVAAAAIGGGTVKIPPGAYLLNFPNTNDGTNGVLLNVLSNVTLEGAGIGNTLLKSAATYNVNRSGNVVYAGEQSNVVIADLSIDGTGLATADCIKIQATDRAIVERVELIGGYIGLNFIACVDSYAQGVTARDAIDATDPTRGFGLQISDNADFAGTDNVRLVNCHAKNCQAAGIAISSTNGATPITGAIVQGCTSSDNTGAGFVLTLANRCQLDGIVAEGNGIYGLDVQSSHYNVIGAHAFRSNGLSGMRVYGSTYNSVGAGASLENSATTPHNDHGYYLTDNGSVGSTHNLFTGIVGSSPATGNQAQGWFEQGANTGNNLVVGGAFEGNAQSRQVFPAATSQILLAKGLTAASVPSNGTLLWVESGILLSRSDTGTIVSGIHPLDGLVSFGSNADTGAISLDTRTRRVFRRTLVGNSTYTLANPQENGEAEIHFIQDGTGGRAIAFASTVLWAGGAAPTWSTAANARDVVRLRYDLALTKWVEVSRSIGVA